MSEGESSEYPSADKMAELDTVLDRLAEGRAQRPTLWGLIEDWRSLVEQVERGYDWSVYEYVNDLHVRRALARVIAQAPTVGDWVGTEIAPLDDRFRAATCDTGDDELLSRVPRFPGPELARDLTDPDATTTMYRPVGDNELSLIQASGYARFPPRLPERAADVLSRPQPGLRRADRRRMERPRRPLRTCHTLCGHDNVPDAVSRTRRRWRSAARAMGSSQRARRILRTTSSAPSKSSQRSRPPRRPANSSRDAKLMLVQSGTAAAAAGSASMQRSCRTR